MYSFITTITGTTDQLGKQFQKLASEAGRTHLTIVSSYLVHCPEPDDKGKIDQKKVIHAWTLAVPRQ